MDRRRVVEQLRAKADSTTFPAEAAALRAKADQLEAKYPPRQRTRACFDTSDPRNRYGAPADPPGPARGAPFDEHLRWISERVAAQQRAAGEAMMRQAAADAAAMRMNIVNGFVSVTGTEGTTTSSEFRFGNVHVTIDLG